MGEVTDQACCASNRPTEFADVLPLPLREVLEFDPDCLVARLLASHTCAPDLAAAIDTARAEGLSLTEIKDADLAYAFACRAPLFEVYRTQYKKALKIGWFPDMTFGHVWRAFVEQSRLPILAWVHACEERADWKRAGSGLTQDTARRAQRDFAEAKLRNKDTSGWVAFYERFWSATATEQFKFGNPIHWIANRWAEWDLQGARKKDDRIGRERIQLGLASPFVYDPEPQIEGPADAAPAEVERRFVPRKETDQLVAEWKEADPGVLGESLRTLGAKDLLLRVCQRIARDTPKRAVLLWLYHSVATQQDDLLAANVAKSASFISQQTKRQRVKKPDGTYQFVNRRIQFWDAFVEVVNAEAEKATQELQDVYALIQCVAHRVVTKLKEDEQ